jgi:flagellin
VELQIRDVDFASKTAELTRNQVLQQTGVSVLGQTNVSTHSALQRLG